MKTVLLLMLASLLSSGAVFAAPLQTSHYMSGELARDRLQVAYSILLSADHVSLAHPTSRPEMLLSTSQVKAVLARLSDLVLDDALYVEDPQNGRYGSIETLIVGKWAGGKWERTIGVSISRDQPYLTITRFDGNGRIVANYLPVLPKVVRLLQAADPDDHSLATFHPHPPPEPVVKDIPASAIARIAEIKPGMTRADVMHIFTTEGGLSSTFHSHYLYRDYGLAGMDARDGLVAVNGKLIKVNVDFAPHDADIVWLNGRGFWLHQSEYHSHSHPVSYNGQPDDIILRVSPPYLEAMILD